MIFSRRLFFCLPVLTLPFLVPACSSEEKFEGRPTIAFVTNCNVPFWEPARAGVIQAGRDLEVNVIYRAPDKQVAEQKQIIEDLMNRGIDGLAVSVMAPDDQKDFLAQTAKSIQVVTHDSDSPDCGRRLFVGVDNYQAGRMCGQMVFDAFPDGGKVAIFVGNLTQKNAIDRRQGVIDAALGRKERGNDPNSGPIKGDNGVVILGTYTDDIEQPKAKANVEDVLNKHPDLAGVVGLFQINPPQALAALRDQRRLGEVKVFGFDEDPDTLSAIEKGYCEGTVVQDPYRYGYESVRLLLELIEGKNDVVPKNDQQFFHVQAELIQKGNLSVFRKKLAQQMSVLEGR